jgi:hypothetical protein
VLRCKKPPYSPALNALRRGQAFLSSTREIPPATVSVRCHITHEAPSPAANLAAAPTPTLYGAAETPLEPSARL